MKTKRLLFLTAVLCSLFTQINPAFAQGTAFTYQGSLTTAGAPANGSYDFAFTLFNASSSGTVVAGPITNTGASVSNGQFTVTLDFGAGVFTGTTYWLQVAVETNGGSGFVALSPLQPITPSPYAIYAPTAGAASTANSAGSVAASGITGQVSLAQLPASVVTNGASGVNISGTFSGNGAGVTNLLNNSVVAAYYTNYYVTAWGDNLGGEATVPPGLTNVVAVAAGGLHTLALKGDGTVVAWGDNAYGSLNIPAGLSNVTAVAAGAAFSLALENNGTVVGWGYNGDGGISIPPGLTNVMAIAAGSFSSLALLGNGTVVAWGSGTSNFPSDGADYGQSIIPPGLTNVVAIAAGGYSSMALKGDGTVVAWGAGKTNNPSDQYDFGQSIVPAGLSNVMAISAGFNHSLALLSNGTIVAWGAGTSNNPGDGYDFGQALPPAGLSNVVAIAAGLNQSVALRNNGMVIEFGYDGYGEANVPAGLSNVFALAQGALAEQVVVDSRTITVGGVFSGNGSGLTSLNASQISSGVFSGNGSGLTSLNASQISSGTLAAAQLPANAVTVSGLSTIQTIAYQAAGVNTLTIPANATQVIVKLWGAGGGPGGAVGTLLGGGGGGFAQKTLSVTPGQTFTIVVGQGGDFENNTYGGNGSGDASGGDPSPVANTGNNQTQGQGGQASSIFSYNGGNYILLAMAGAGGGGGLGSVGGAGGNPGQAGGPTASAAPNNGGSGGNNGTGGAGGIYVVNLPQFNGQGGGAGAAIAANITTTGVAALSSVGGKGGTGANNSSLATGAGGGGGGYGGGGGGAIQTQNTGQAFFGAGGGGGGSFGDTTMVGNGTNAANRSDTNYVAPNGQGGQGTGVGYNGLVVVLVQAPAAIVNAGLVVSGPLYASGAVVAGGTLTASGILNANGPLNANGTLTANGTLNADGPFNASGNITLNNAVSNVLQFNMAGVAPPSDSSVGWKLRTYIPGYGIGISAGTQWYSTVSYHQWWIDVSGTYSQIMSLDGSGDLGVAGTFYAPGNIITGGAVMSTNGGGFYFNDRVSTSSYGQWALYANNGKALLYNTKVNGTGGNLTSVDLSGNYRTAGTITASTSPDLAETISAAADVTPGDVVCADPLHSESAILCDKNSKGVLGVISDGTGGFLINARSESAEGPLTGQPLVLVGRVPVKVSLENGPIQIGDYLAPSSTPGVAMRGTAAGLVIGIALEAFDSAKSSPPTPSAKGKVLCFVKVGEANTAAAIKALTEKAAKVDSLEKRITDLEQALQKLAK